MPRASAINKKKVQKNLFGNRLSPTEDTDAVFEQSEKLAKKILEEKEESVSQEIKKRTTLTTKDKTRDTTEDKTRDISKVYLEESILRTKDKTEDISEDKTRDNHKDKSDSPILSSLHPTVLQSKPLPKNNNETPSQPKAIHLNSASSMPTEELTKNFNHTNETKDKTRDITEDTNKATYSDHNLKTEDNTKDTTEDTPIPPHLIKETKDKTTDKSTKTKDKLGSHPRTNLGTKPRTKLMQDTPIERSYSELSPLQQKIIKEIYLSCVQNSDRISLRLSISYLSDQISASADSIKRTIRRLMKENMLDKYQWKDGRGGWTQYELHPALYSSLFGVINATTTDKTEDITRDKLGTHPRTAPSSSSNYINNNINKETTITTDTEVPTQENIFNLDAKWMEIDFFGLNERDKISFGMNDLKKIAERKLLSSEQVQESIEAFANDFEKGIVRSKGSKRNLFIGTLLKGNQYYSLDQGFKSAEDQFLEDQLRIKIQKDKERKKLEEEASEIYFSEWVTTISEEDRDKLLKESGLLLDNVTYKDHMKSRLLKSYYMDHEWPKVMAEFRSSLGKQNLEN